MNRVMAIALIVVLQTAVLVVMIAQRQITLEQGTRILLETRPIDPRSLFRGDYVRLNYTISDIVLSEVDGDDEFKRHDAVYVVLQQGERYWEPSAVYHDVPRVSQDEVVLKGEVSYYFETTWDPEERITIDSPHMRMRYGIENYFVPEGEGRKLERPAEGDKIEIEVAVGGDGKAAISGLLLNQRRLYEEGLF